MGRRIVTEKLQAQGAGDSVDGYLDRVVKYIPADIVAAYVFASGAIAASTVDDPEILLWIVSGVLAVITPIWILRMASSAGKPAPKTQAIVSLGAFCVWVFALGGPFAETSWYDPLYGSLLLVFYTLATALITPKE